MDGATTDRPSVQDDPEASVMNPIRAQDAHPSDSRRRRGVSRRSGAWARVVPLLAVVFVATGSSRGESPARPEPATTSSTAAATRPVMSPPAPTTATTTAAAFATTVAPITPGTVARMASSWRPGCPVPLADLRLVTVTHWGFDGRPHQGELVVHADHAEAIGAVFAELFEAGFPIEQVRLVDEFGGDDNRSMAANNTSAFNCRRATGSARWSEHAFGRAVDINPVQNPYLTRGGAVLPPAGGGFTDRTSTVQGLITAEGSVVAAFRRIGWRWGGAWPNPDYQHFSATGR
jgi:hypothetical protein